MASLSNMAFEDAHKRILVEEHNGLDLLVDLLRTSRDNGTLSHAARGIFSISTVYEYKERIGELFSFCVSYISM